jgi:RHH-type proline utilization regulon transcriptional repressor/proline dehydrogenase/delta 1-pyrroline-5-carboxylate dehydrogenase
MAAMQTAPTPHPAASIDWDALDALKYQDEDAAVAALLADPPLDPAARASVKAEARALVTGARGLKRRKGVMESFLEEFGLSNAEGLALMCLAEALLRVPDEETADKLIAEKITSATPITGSSTPAPGASCSLAASSISRTR